MTGTHGSGAVVQIFQHQADAAISQANPVSTTLYEVLPTTKNVRLISVAAAITWAVTQPTPLEAHVLIDGVSMIFLKTDPVTGTAYFAQVWGDPSAINQGLTAVEDVGRSFLLEGKSVKVEVEIAWATTQPTNLTMRVKWAKIP